MTAPAAPARDRWTIVTMAVLLAAAVGLQAAGDRLAPPRQPPPPTLWLQSPEATRRIMLSFTDLAADVYWTRAVVHYGGERRAQAASGRYALLYPLLDMTTTLDPHFDVAARMGAIFLSEGYPGGPGRPDQALQLLRKGLRVDPDRWQYRHDIAFVHYWWLKDYSAAAQEFEAASTLPGAPAWLRTMAAVTLTKGGDRAAARKMWSELLATADLDWMRDAAGYRLRQLAALDDLDALTEQLARFRGRTDVSWALLIRAGALSGVPVDPTGVPYEITPDGAVVLGAGSSLAPLPDIDTKP